MDSNPVDKKAVYCTARNTHLHFKSTGFGLSKNHFEKVCWDSHPVLANNLLNNKDDCSTSNREIIRTFWHEGPAE